MIWLLVEEDSKATTLFIFLEAKTPFLKLLQTIGAPHLPTEEQGRRPGIRASVSNFRYAGAPTSSEDMSGVLQQFHRIQNKQNSVNGYGKLVLSTIGTSATNHQDKRVPGSRPVIYPVASKVQKNLDDMYGSQHKVHLTCVLADKARKCTQDACALRSRSRKGQDFDKSISLAEKHLISFALP
jgi:hypothetical protein